MAAAPGDVALKLLARIQGRIARPAPFHRNMVKTLIQMIVMWAIFFGIGPALAYRLESKTPLRGYRFASRRWRATGVVTFLLGWTLAETSAVYMVREGHGTPLPADAPRDLVIAGPYRYVRNPMAMGSFAQGFALAMFVGSPLVTAYVLAGAVGWNYLVRPWEEADLERRFGKPYARYRDSVPCWTPRLRPYLTNVSE
jgi:protein-S-isoprenylcysteine O-methyltransferase Ste14